MAEKNKLTTGFSSLVRKFSTSKQKTARNNNNDDDPYAILADYDIKFLIDDSASMASDTPSRWSQVAQVLGDIAPICTKYDSDGIDVHFLNQVDQRAFCGIKKEKTVHTLFSTTHPTNGTPTARRLSDILTPYVNECVRRHRSAQEPPRPLNLIVITDGLPDRNPEDVLLWAARTLDEIEAIGTQLGVRFVQVGDEVEAAEALRKLDDELCTKYDCRDFIDTVPYFARAMGGRFDEGLVLKTVLGSILRRHDKVRVGRGGV